MAFLTRIQLTEFRCYASASLEGLGRGPIVLYGPNGAGKTNVLEAVSLLSPGKGLRNAKIAEMQRQVSPDSTPSRPLAGGRVGEGGIEEAGWTVVAEAETFYGPARIGTGRESATDKRIVRINEDTKSQVALSDYLSCVWLTPQMDRLFLDTASSRRKFLDRLIFAFDPGHSGRTTRFENGMAQRSKILREHDRPDPLWLDSLEASMAETGIAIAAARLDFLVRLQAACDAAGLEQDRLFPRAILSMRGTLEELLTHAPALEIEDLYKYQLRQSRSIDASTGGAATGPHKSDLAVSYAAKSMPASQCSTGEQKALLISLILAHSRLIAAERGAPPILLLDEVAAHLDETRRAGLYELLMALGGQVWMTGTDRNLFDALTSYAPLIFAVEASQIHPISAPRAA
jgi:DNA replication and repair protein RecF